MENLSIDWRAFSKRRNIDIEAFIKIYLIKSCDDFFSICSNIKVQPPSREIIEVAIDSIKEKNRIQVLEKKSQEKNDKKLIPKRKRTTKAKK